MLKENLINKFINKNLEEEIVGRERCLNAGVMALFCEVDGEINILFERRANKIAQGGEVSLPGGIKDEEDEDFIETALRETYEEVGIKKERIKYFRKYGKLIIATGVILEITVGYIENFSLDELNINCDEVARVFLVPLKYFLETDPRIEKVTIENNPYVEENGKIKEFPVKELGLPKKYEKTWQTKKRPIYFYMYDGEIIWGMTGEIIYNLSNKIKNILNL